MKVEEHNSLTEIELLRYSRHTILPQMGEKGQLILKNSRILVVGAGGLGSPILAYLSAAGIGKIGIIDDDKVEQSNLQRQILHNEKDIGRLKVDSVVDKIKSLNSNIDVVSYSKRLDKENAIQIINNYDLIIDGTDNFPTRYLLNDACEILNKTWIFGSIHQFEGQVTTFNHKGGPNYRDLFPEPPPSNMIQNCEEGGVLGILPGVIGTMQATEAIKLLLNLGSNLSGKLLVYDALSMNTKLFSYTRTERITVTELGIYTGSCSVEEEVSQIPHQNISPLLAKRKMDEGWEPFVLDVRTEKESMIATIKNTNLLVPHIQIMNNTEKIPKDKDILVYCHHGGRSSMAATILNNLGFDSSRLFNLDGGINLWAIEVDMSLPRY